MFPRSQLRKLSVAMLGVSLTLCALITPVTPVAAASSLSLSRSTAGQGDTITVTGFGFAPLDTVVVASNLHVTGVLDVVQSSALSTESGVFQASITLPSATNQGTYSVYARDFHGHYAARDLTVLPLAYARAGGPSSTTYVIPTHQFYVSGAGFVPGESVRVTAVFPLYDGDSVTADHTVHASASGLFSELLIGVPSDSKAGNVRLVARGQTSRRTGTAQLAVVYRPALVQPATVRPGTNVSIAGHGFVPASVISISLPIARIGQVTETLSRDATTDGLGNFSTFLTLPTNARLGTYLIGAYDTVGNFRATTSVLVSVHPTISIQPTAVFPGQAFTVSGDNFGTGVRVTVTGDFVLRGIGTRGVSGSAQTGAHGEYSVRLVAPMLALAGRVAIVARSSDAQVSTHLQVTLRPTPTATPRHPPTATPTPTSTPTPTPTPTLPPPKHHKFAFRSISIWYHTVTSGTWDHIVLQSTLKTVQGVWITVRFPSNLNEAFYTETNSSGHYQRTFDVPSSALSGGNPGTALITIKLWHGSKSRTAYETITVIP
jgi:hypothetical protein